MKLEKSTAGRVLIFLYYALFGTGAFFLMMFIMVKVGILTGFAAGIALGVVCGIIGGELEFREHRKTIRKKYTAGNWQNQDSNKEPHKVLVFKK